LRNSNLHLPLGKQLIAHVKQNSIRDYCRHNPPQPSLSSNEQDPLTLCCPREAAGAAVAGDSSYAAAEGFIHKDTVISVVVFPLHLCLGACQLNLLPLSGTQKQLQPWWQEAS